MPSPFARHIEACNNLASPAHLVPFRIAGQQVGWLSRDLARALAFWPREFHFDAQGVSLAARLRSAGARSDALAEVCRSLARRGFFRLRGEAFDLRASSDGPALATLDRGALPAFGAISQGVHVNGLVRRADGLHLWVGWRSRAKSVAPGQLDNLIAGGVPAGLSVEETLVKEAEEEASVPAHLAVTARRAGRVSYVMAQPEGGLRRDVLHCYDLDLPESFEPRPNDDEMERFELWPASRVLEFVRDTDAVKFNVNLVLIDLFLRQGLIDPESPEGRELRAGLDQGPEARAGGGWQAAEA
jgi:8-oxo-dGTP pyrophosphatase MutT (NUDIX family)